MYPMRAWHLYLAMVCADVLLGIWQGIRLWREKRGKTLLYFLLLALFPLANCFIYVMSDFVHGLMTFPLVMQTVLFVWLAERAPERVSPRKNAASKGWPGLRQVISGLAAVILGFTCVAYARFDNQCYLKGAFQQQQAISFFTALTAGIKAAPGFSDETPVVFLHEEKIADQTLYNIDELDFIHLDPYGGTIREMISSYAWRSFMERWCGFCPVYADPASYENLAEVQAMPHYPDDGSILRIGDVMVVNF